MAAFFVVFALVAGCGAGPECDGAEAVTERFSAQVALVEACVGLTGASQLGVRFEATGACPTSGRHCCLAGVGVIDCGDGSGAQCGAAGRFDPSCMMIRLPDECSQALKHELIHGLLYLNGISGWADHAHPAFQCEGRVSCAEP